MTLRWFKGGNGFVDCCIDCFLLQTVSAKWIKETAKTISWYQLMLTKQSTRLGNSINVSKGCRWGGMQEQPLQGTFWGGCCLMSKVSLGSVYINAHPRISQLQSKASSLQRRVLVFISAFKPTNPLTQRCQGSWTSASVGPSPSMGTVWFRVVLCLLCRKQCKRYGFVTCTRNLWTLGGNKCLYGGGGFSPEEHNLSAISV